MKIGLTGGIAVGKSTVFSRLLSHKRVIGFDADLAVRELYQCEEVIDLLMNHFGREIVSTDGKISRSHLRGIFLKSPEVKKTLEHIFHPRVKELYKCTASEMLNDEILVADIPLLFETGNQYGFDSVIVVACTAKTQLIRLKERSSLDTETAKDMISTQLPIGEKIKKADFVLWNEGTPAQLHKQIDTLTHHLFLNE